jgi:hypothetical protein
MRVSLTPRIQCAGLYSKQRKQERPQPVARIYHRPQLQDLAKIFLFRQSKNDWIKGIFGKQLRTSNDDGQKTYRVYRRSDKMCCGRLSEQPGYEPGRKTCQSHGQSAGNPGKPKGGPWPLQLVSGVADSRFKYFMCGEPLGIPKGFRLIRHRLL